MRIYSVPQIGLEFDEQLCFIFPSIMNLGFISRYSVLRAPVLFLIFIHTPVDCGQKKMLGPHQYGGKMDYFHHFIPFMREVLVAQTHPEIKNIKLHIVTDIKLKMKRKYYSKVNRRFVCVVVTACPRDKIYYIKCQIQFYLKPFYPRRGWIIILPSMPPGHDPLQLKPKGDLKIPDSCRTFFMDGP